MKKIAIQARQDLESGTVDQELLRILYISYNPLSRSKLFIERSRTLFPSLNCGIASCYLKHLYGRGEIKTGNYKNNPHTFLQIKNIIIDITADQFGGPPVYIGKLKYPWSL